MRIKVSIYVLLAGLALAGCGKDSILPNEDPGNNGSGSSTSGVTPTTIEVNYDEEDLIEGTTSSAPSPSPFPMRETQRLPVTRTAL